MGADMLVYMLPACDVTEDRLRALDAVIDGLTEPNLEYVRECVLPDMTDDETKEALRTVARELQDAQTRRDVTVWVGDPMPYPMMMTGGLSWGDDPTDACRIFGTIGAVNPAWELLETWAREDAA